MTKDALHILSSLRRPTNNPTTDAFGIDRCWGRRCWSPDAGYSPIHGGIDYSASPDPVVYMPCDGWTFGQWVGGAIGSAVWIRPTLGEDAVDNVMLVLFHCEPTADEWLYCRAGDPITQHAGHGVGEPHLHLEANVTPEVTEAMIAEGMLIDREVSRHTIRGKAARKRIDPDAAEGAVADQQSRWGMRWIGYDYLIRERLPGYRHSQYSRVGKGETHVINLTGLLR